MRMQSSKKIFYEENTREYLDNVAIWRKKVEIKKGRSDLVNNIIIGGGALLVLLYIIINLSKATQIGLLNEPLFYLSIAGLLFMGLLLATDLKILITTSNLKIYEEGITLPRRTFSEWLKGEEHFIPYKDIKEIVIETHYRTGRPLRVKIVKKDGTVETLGASWFLDLDEFKRVIARQGRVEIREVERFVF